MYDISAAVRTLEEVLNMPFCKSVQERRAFNLAALEARAKFPYMRGAIGIYDRYNATIRTFVIEKDGEPMIRRALKAARAELLEFQQTGTRPEPKGLYFYD